MQSSVVLSAALFCALALYPGTAYGCSKEGDRIGVAYDCQMYRECTDGRMVDRRCSWLRRFDSGSGECVLAWWSHRCYRPEDTKEEAAPKPGEGCTPGARTGVQDNCRIYMECDAKGQWVTMRCLTCKNYSPNTQKCEWPWKYRCPHSPGKQAAAAYCGENGSRRPIDCKKYEECSGNVWTEQSCWWGTSFDQKGLRCTASFLANC